MMRPDFVAHGSRDTLAFASHPTGLRDPFLESPAKFSHPERPSKISNLVLQSCFIHIFLLWTEVLLGSISVDLWSPDCVSPRGGK